MGLVDDDEAEAPILEDDALPAGWSGRITETAEACGCPRDYVAGALIATASALIGNAGHVGPTADWTEQPHLWNALVGAPSTGKSPALRPFFEVVEKLKAEAEPDYRDARAHHAALVEQARIAEETWQKEAREVCREKITPPDRPAAADPPATPPKFWIKAMDVSTEELQRILSRQPRGLLYVREELAGWIGSFDRYGGNGADRAFYLES
jgi:Protein of unknown function (DUF3987)